MLGKTNTPEFGTGSHTFNPVFGADPQPVGRSTRSAGGSSGGAAAALASRMVPLADGSDLGGSLRNPAAWNSVVGLRPTPGLVPAWPDSPAWMPYAVEGPMARTVEDAALLLAAMSGPDPRARQSAVGRAVRAAATLESDVTGRRIAWSPSIGGLPVESDVLGRPRAGARSASGSSPVGRADEPDSPAPTWCSRSGAPTPWLSGWPSSPAEASA